MFSKKLTTLLLMLGTILDTSRASNKPLNRIEEYYKTKFLEKGCHILNIEVILVPMPPGYIDSEGWSLDSILLLMVFIKESKAAELMYRAFKYITKPSKSMQPKREGNTSEPRTVKELVLNIRNSSQAKFPSSKISLKMIKKFLLPQEIEEWLTGKKLYRRMRRKNNREQVLGGGRIFKANRDKGAKAHQNRWVEAGHYGNRIGDGHHFDWVTRPHRGGNWGVSAGREWYREGHHGTGKWGKGSHNWGRSRHHSNVAGDRGRVRPVVGGGPGKTHFPSTGHDGGVRSVWSVDDHQSDNDWGKVGHRGGGGVSVTAHHGNAGKNWGGISGHAPRGVTVRGGAFIGGGPGKTRLTSTSHARGSIGKGRYDNFNGDDSSRAESSHYGGKGWGRGRYFSSSDRVRSGHIIGGGLKSRYLGSNDGNRARGGRIIGGGPLRTRFTSTGLPGGGRGRNDFLDNDGSSRVGGIHHIGGSGIDSGRGVPIIGGGPLRTRFTSTGVPGGGRGRNGYLGDNGPNRDGDIRHVGSSNGNRGRGGPIVGGGPLKTRFTSTGLPKSGSGYIGDNGASRGEGIRHGGNSGDKRGRSGPIIGGGLARNYLPSKSRFSVGKGLGGDNGVRVKSGSIIGGAPTRGYLPSTHIIKNTRKYVNDYYYNK